MSLLIEVDVHQREWDHLLISLSGPPLNVGCGWRSAQRLFVSVCSGSILKKLLHTGNSFKVSVDCSRARGRELRSCWSDGAVPPHAVVCWGLDPLRGDPSLPAVAAGPEGQLCRGAVPYLCLSGTRVPGCALLQGALHPGYNHL